MIDKINKWLPLITVILVVLVLVGGNQSAGFGGTRTQNGLSADSTSPIAGEVRGTTLTSTGLATLSSVTVTGTLTQSTTNSATTTAAVGCIQTVATSTATKIRLIIGTANTGASSTASTAAVGGFVTWGYGSCPN